MLTLIRDISHMVRVYNWACKATPWSKDTVACITQQNHTAVHKHVIRVKVSSVHILHAWLEFFHISVYFQQFSTSFRVRSVLTAPLLSLTEFAELSSFSVCWISTRMAENGWLSLLFSKSFPNPNEIDDFPTVPAGVGPTPCVAHARAAATGPLQRERRIQALHDAHATY